MTELVKNFIEDNIELIENEDWDSLFDEANDLFLNSKIAELTKILTTGLNIEVEKFAKDHVMKMFVTELRNFKSQPNISMVSLHDLTTYYMPTINGLDFDEFQSMVEEYLKGDKDYLVKFDGQGDLYIQKVKKI